MRVSRLGWAFYVDDKLPWLLSNWPSHKSAQYNTTVTTPTPNFLTTLAIYGELSKVCFILNHQHSHHDPSGADVRMGAGEGVREDLVTCLRPGAHTSALLV